MQASDSELWLRQADGQDYERIRNWFTNSDELKTWGGSEVVFPLDRDQFLQMLREADKNPAERICYSFEVSNGLCGHAQIALNHADRVGRLARVALAPEYRGKGLARPMLIRAIAKFFELGFDRLELNVYANNLPAHRLYRSLGFALEGTRRLGAILSYGRVDINIMGLLRPEFKA